MTEKVPLQACAANRTRGHDVPQDNCAGLEKGEGA
jgi:hypothetical protein